MKPILTLAILFPFLPVAARELEIQAGNFTRTNSLVTVEKPDAYTTGSVLESDDGKAIPLQMTGDGKLIFNLDHLEAGKKIAYKLVPKDPPSEETILAQKDGDQIKFLNGQKSIATYQAATKTSPRENLDPKFLRGGYLHPLFTPAGDAVTDDYALNHLHHHGIWTAWTKASYQGRDTDFWNMGQGKGKVDFVSLEKTWNGPIQAGLISHHKFTDLTSGKPIDVLDEKWTVKVSDSFLHNTIDLEIEQSLIGNEPLKLPTYHYGGLGIRGLDAWNGKSNATFLTSEKSDDRIKANSQSARWIRMSGKVGNDQGTIAILSHPENFRAPQPVRIHPTEPFISIAPQISGEMEIKPGEPYQMNYRFIISDGKLTEDLLENLWQDYAHPVTATWKN